MAWHAVWTNQLGALTQAQKQDNVDIIYAHFHALGWNDMPIAAMLGNMEVESQLNPAQWENGQPIYGSGNVGFGLSQWTPWTKYRDWVNNNLSTNWETDYNAQLSRLDWEADPAHQGNVIPEGQWIPVSAYSNYTFQQFAHDTTHTLRWLVECYERSYERGTPMFDQRTAFAQTWYDYIQSGPTPPTPPTPTPRTKIPVWMMCKPRWKG